MQAERPVEPKRESDRLANELKAAGHDILAAQVRIAARYPERGVLRQIVAENVKRLADRG